MFDDLELAEDESPTSQPQLELGFSQTNVSDGHSTSTSPWHSRQQSDRLLSGDSTVLGISTLRRAQVPPVTGHLDSRLMLSLMHQKDQIEIFNMLLAQSRASNETHAAHDVAPILMVREHPPFLPNGATSSLRIGWSDVEDLLSEKQRYELVRLFFHFVQPAFPVLQRSTGADSDCQNDLEPNSTSLALSACIYATALPFSIHNDYLNATLTDANGKREQLYAITVAAILWEANSPSVETLRACLLLLQKGPMAQQQGLTPTYSCFASLAVTIAKSLGLQYDCKSWSIPLPEKHLRRRLWWATFVMDIWISIDNPGGSSIGSQDFDVPLPVSDGLEWRESDRTEDHIHFDCLVQLTHFLLQIHEAYYTIRAAKETASELFRSLELAKPLRSTLNECKQNLKILMPLNGVVNTGANGSVHLASCVTSIILFRALLRPIQRVVPTMGSSEDSQILAAAAIMTGSINCAREAIELLESLVSIVGPWNEFWHSWSQGNFAIVSTFLVQLMLMSKSDESAKSEVVELIARWKRAIRIGAGSGGWGSSLMSMALSRLDSLLSHAAA